MDTNKLSLWLLGTLLAALTGTTAAATRTEPPALSDDVTVRFLWTVDAGDLAFDFGTSDYIAPRTWVLNRDPKKAPVAPGSAWVFAAADLAPGGAAVSVAGTTLTIEFDYAPRNAPLGDAVIQDHYVLTLWHGVKAGVQASLAPTFVHPNPVKPAFGFSPAPSAAQLRQSDNGLASPPADAAAPFPDSVVMMASAVTFLGLSHRSDRALKTT